jgi:predicted nucleic acid-binding protein
MNPPLSGSAPSAAAAIVSSPELCFLDTNAYALLLSGNPPEANSRLHSRMSQGAYLEATISELTSLEIHSVIGQLARGSTAGLHACERNIFSGGQLVACSQKWSQVERKALRPLELDRLRKAVKDAERGHGPIRLTVIPVDPDDIHKGREYLYSHSTTWRFGSHDAILAASVARYKGGACRLVTSDRGLKALCRSVGLHYYDPRKDEEWN